MKTPTGKDCPYFFGDYFRGRSIEECRLIGKNPPPQNWTRDLCKNCPVPVITLANACPNITLRPTIKSGFLGFSRRVVISAWCSKSQSDVKIPEVGCGLCHPLDPFINHEQQVK